MGIETRPLRPAAREHFYTWRTDIASQDTPMTTSFRALATTASLTSLLSYASVMLITPASINEIGRTYDLQEQQLGVLFLALAVAFMFTVLGAGRFSDRYGKLRSMFIGNVIMAVGLCLFGSARSFEMAILASAINGIGGGFTEGTAMSLVADLYVGRRQTSWVNASQAAFGVGAMGSPVLISLLIRSGYHWQTGYFLVAAICTCCALIALAGILAKGEKPVGAHAEHGSWRKLVSDRFLAWMCVGVFLYVSAELGTSSWLARHFRFGLHSSWALAAQSNAYYWAGLLGGRLAAAWASHKMDEISLIRLCLGGAAAAHVALLLAGAPGPALVCSTILGFFLGPIFPTIFSVAGKSHPQQSGTVGGIVLVFGSFGSVVTPPVIGLLSATVGISHALWMSVVILAGNLVMYTWIGRKHKA